MARYRTTITSPWTAERAFAYVADLETFDQWDPSVSSAERVAGTEPGVGAEYDLQFGPMTLHYVTHEHEPPTRTVVEADSTLLRSYDVIDVTPAGDGCVVHYDALVELPAWLRLADPLLQFGFDRAGAKAAAGLADALDGRIVADDAASA